MSKTKRTTKKTLKEVLAAISGSDGVKAVVAKRLGVQRGTVDNYLKRWKAAQVAFDNEVDSIADMSISLLARNIKLGLKEQTDTGKPVRSDDAKWWLARKGGFEKKVEHKGDNAITLRVVYDDPVNE
jgi:hypothetical protein